MAPPSWLFGYGSLIWRPDFPFVERRTARLPGWTRRFWQESIDHRGIVERPGRVVTLVRDPGGWCDGVAFRLPSGQRDAILAQLDHRERGGYARHVVSVHALGDACRADIDALVYVATADNPQYAGPAPLEAIAEQIRGATGPSGPNPEYLTRLAKALRAIGADDEHVYALERLVTESTRLEAP